MIDPAKKNPRVTQTRSDLVSASNISQTLTMASSLTTTDLQGSLPLIARGKVRDLYEVDDKTLLFVATDRISAYDVIMENVHPSRPFSCLTAPFFQSYTY